MLPPNDCQKKSNLKSFIRTTKNKQIISSRETGLNKTESTSLHSEIRFVLNNNVHLISPSQPQLIYIFSKEKNFFTYTLHNIQLQCYTLQRGGFFFCNESKNEKIKFSLV